MSTIITLAALWILRYPIIFLVCLILSSVAWPFRLVGDLIGCLSDDAVFWILMSASLGGLASLVGTIIYLM